MRITIFLLLIMPLVVAMGCSRNASNPVQSRDLNPESIDFTINPDDTTDNYLAGNWTLVFDPEKMDLKPVLDRCLSQDWDITPLFPFPTFQIISYDPLTGMLEVDATITNSTSITGYDLRLIVYTDNVGIRLLNADDWTAAFDIPGGMFINPFKAYAKDTVNRAFEGNGTKHTQRLQLYFPSGSLSISFAITTAWPENCNEPYQLVGFTQGILYHLPTCRTDIQVDVYDWQNDVNSVMLWCPAITGVDLAPMVNTLANRWELELINNTGASPGNYMAAIVATSAGSGSEALYDIIQITVTKAYALNGNSIGFGGLSTDTGYGITVDNSDMIYVCGSFNGTVDFDPGPKITERTSAGNYDAFMCKFDPQWNLLWVHTWGNTNYDDAYDIETDGAGSITVTGGFCGSVDMNPGPGVDMHNSNNINAEHIFINKFDLNGNFLWSRTWGGGGSSQAGRDVDIDPSGNIYVSGYFHGTVDFDPGPGTDTHISAGSTDIFVVKYGPGGAYLWGRTWGGPNADYGYGVDVNLDNIFVCGAYRGTVDFDPGSGVNSFTSNSNSYDSFVSRFISDGTYYWVRVWGGSAEDVSYRCVSNASNEIYITGHYFNTVDFDPGAGVDSSTSLGGADIFLSKFDLIGNYIWGRRWGSNEQYGEYAFAIALDDTQRVYVTGRVRGDVDYDPGPGEFIIGSMASDLFLSIFNPTGDFAWAQVWGGWGGERGYGVVNHGPLTYITGYYQSTVDFYPGSGNDIWTATGDLDAFVLRYRH
jgi:hypothetical protein